MSATFRTRPWLLASSARPASLPAFNSRMLLSNMQQSRHAATRSKRLPPGFRAALKNTMKSRDATPATSSMTQERLQEQKSLDETEMAVLSPRTIVPVSPFKIEGWSKRFTYCKEVFLQRFTDRTQIFFNTWRLKQKRFSFATFRARRKGVVETALRLHAEMSTCLAKGGSAEKARLAEICIPKLHRSLIAAVETRPKGKSFKWELLSLKGKPFWPRLIDHKWTEVDVGFKQSFRQAVVGIKSKQRLTEIDANGKERGSREMDVTEYVVLWRPLDMAKRTQGDWKIYGTLKETTYETLIAEKDALKKMMNTMTRKKVEAAEKGLNKS